MPADFLACCKEKGAHIFTLDGDRDVPSVPKGHSRTMCEDSRGVMHAGELKKKKAKGGKK